VKCYEDFCGGLRCQISREKCSGKGVSLLTVIV
jgi:hypothetical protein